MPIDSYIDEPLNAGSLDEIGSDLSIPGSVYGGPPFSWLDIMELWFLCQMGGQVDLLTTAGE